MAVLTKDGTAGTSELGDEADIRAPTDLPGPGSRLHLSGAGPDAGAGSAVRSFVERAAADVAAGNPAAGGKGQRFDTLLTQLSRGGGDFFDFLGPAKLRTGAGYVDCAICSKKFPDTSLLEGRHEVKLLDCFHSVCGPCLQVELSQNTGEFECPLCLTSQKKRPLHEYLPHFEVHSIIDSEKIRQKDFNCEECVSGNRAEVYCQNCVMNLCAGCARQHKRAKATVRHSLVSLKEQDATGGSSESGAVASGTVHRAQFCAIHRNSRYELYCEDCETVICYYCAADAHQTHNYKLPSAALIERHRRAIHEAVEKLCEQLLEAKERHRQLQEAFEDSESMVAKTRTDVEEAFNALLKAAEARCEAMTKSLADCIREERGKLVEEKSKVSTALVDIWRSIDFLEKVISRGTDIEVLKVKGHIFKEQNQLRQLQHWRELAYMTNDIEASEIVAGWRSVQEREKLLSALASFGSVEVQPKAEGHSAVEASTRTPAAGGASGLSPEAFMGEAQWGKKSKALCWSDFDCES